ncbi:MAG: hypothetical protein R3272_13790 [Candidatus Promineifilaceae bacterium]|nr:hypothetical protein [Candidatus Promineifilaceae bacterium]
MGAFSAFFVAAVTMSALMFALAVLIGMGQQRAVNVLKVETARVRGWSGIVLMVVGGWLIALAIWADFFARYFPV